MKEASYRRGKPPNSQIYKILIRFFIAIWQFIYISGKAAYDIIYISLVLCIYDSSCSV